MLRHGEALHVELQQRADERDDGRAGERADDGAVAAENRAAADDDGGDAVELAELAGDRIEAAEIGDVDEPGHGRADGAEEERDEADAVGVDAGIGGGADVAAGRVELLAEGHVAEHDAGDDGDEDHPERLHADDLGDRADEAARMRDVEVVQDVADLAADEVVAARSSR